jgi:flagellar hook protein FlgE
MPLTSFYTALTGLNTNSSAINVIGDNLANMNTTAFKSGKANFSELLGGLSGTSSTGNPIVNGLGSTLNGITHLTTQGTITSSGKTTDAAINGNGFFVVATEGGMGFTRAGKFEFDSQGNFISSDGFQAMGYMAANGAINSSGTIVPIEVRKGQLTPATATTSFSISANLDSQAANSSTYASSVRIYDSLGTAHTVTFEFTKVGTGNYTWTAAIPATDTGGAIGGTPVQVGSGAMAFDNAGQLTAATTDGTLNLTGLASGAANMTVTFNLRDSGGNGLITNYASASSVSSSTQNGSSASRLKDINIDSSGIIVGIAESGQSIQLAQLALADFPNIEGLQKYKGSTFVSFTSSGEPSVGTAGTGGRGTVVGSALEQSNVDMAAEFVNLIVAQRAYQANAKVITTTDEMYQDSINLKR